MSFPLKKVLISDDIDQKCNDILQKNGIEVVKKTKLSKEELLQEIVQNYDGLIVRSATKVTADIINAAPQLKIIGRAGTGVDNIDCGAATKHGVIVMNTPGGNTMSAAEHTCAMIMAVSRHIPQGHTSMRDGRWDRKKFMGNEVYGKTLAIIGLGRIGKEVALRMQAFGMTTIGYDPIVPAEESAQFNTEWLPLEQIWPLADYITVHTPLIPQTRNLINLDVLSRCKKGVKLINVARGGIIEEDAIIPAIEQGYCGGAGLDVFTEEPPTNKALTQHDKIVCTPHLGASTTEAQTRVAEEIAQQFVDLAEGRQLFGAINAQALTNALSPSTKPWVQCGRSLGTLASSLIQIGKENAHCTLKLQTQGPDLKSASSYLVAALYSGLLNKLSNVPLNLISAPALAKEYGLKISTEHSDADTNSVTLTLTFGAATFTLQGQTDGCHSFLTQFNGFKFSQPVVMRGNLLLLEAQNSTKLVGELFAALIKSNVSPTSYSSTDQTGDQASFHALHISAPVPNQDVLKSLVTKSYQVSL